MSVIPTVRARIRRNERSGKANLRHIHPSAENISLIISFIFQ